MRENEYTWSGVRTYTDQGSAKYSLGPNLGSKASSEHSHIVHLHTVYGCFHDTTARLTSCNGDLVGPQSQKYFLSGPIRKKLADS